MGIVSDTILPAAVRNRANAEKLITGISRKIFARKPPNINLNHAAFNLGHLAVYFPRILTISGLDPKRAEVPANYFDLFPHGAPCHDDPRGSIYPPMEEIVAAFSGAYDAALALIPGAADEIFAGPPPDEKMKSLFATTAAAVNYLLVNHVALHLGQLSAWRRCMGLPPAA